jgi:hypothetical protein
MEGASDDRPETAMNGDRLDELLGRVIGDLWCTASATRSCRTRSAPRVAIDWALYLLIVGDVMQAKESLYCESTNTATATGVPGSHF